MDNTIKVVCFGEVLWDVLPTVRKLGGAPMNVSYHLSRLGISSALISRVGNDEQGLELASLLQELDLDTRFLQVDDRYKTSEVLATMNESNEVSYEIVQSVAWDYIECLNEDKRLVEQADVFVFGSLAARSVISRNTLYQLIEKAKFKIFDVNFRSPHYTKETVEYLLKKADTVKLNEQEAEVIGEWMGMFKATEYSIITEMMNQYQIQEVVLTKGSQGASYYTPRSRHDQKAYPVVVKDTVGSGDSFLAAFISQKLRGVPIEDSMEFAAALGAFITTHAGANPAYKKTDLNHFIWKRNLGKV